MLIAVTSAPMNLANCRPRCIASSVFSLPSVGIRMCLNRLISDPHGHGE